MNRKLPTLVLNIPTKPVYLGCTNYQIHIIRGSRTHNDNQLLLETAAVYQSLPDKVGTGSKSALVSLIDFGCKDLNS